MSTIVRVALAHHHDRSYDILIEPGLFRQIPEMLVSRFPRHSCAIISDSNVAALYGQDLLERIRAVSGNPCFLYTFLHGEERKTRETKSMLEDAMFHNQHDRKTLVIALGGGVTGDLAGYLAATYMRGVPFVQIPTSLLAQVDSSVGGKTGVDVPAGKNLVGAFWQPSGVYIDPNLLSTLPEREYLSGLGEIVKHALMFSPEMIHLLEHGQHPIMERDPLMMADLVAKNCTIKAGVVSADETESGLRRTLNFGHTVAHAIELASGYSVSHGVAVMAGILVEVRAAVLSGLLSEESATAMGTTVMRYLHNPPGIQNFDPDTMVQAMLLDKKNTEGAIHCSLPEAPGIPPDCTWTRAFSEEILKAALRDVFLPTGG